MFFILANRMASHSASPLADLLISTNAFNEFRKEHGFHKSKATSDLIYWRMFKFLHNCVEYLQSEDWKPTAVRLIIENKCIDIDSISRDDYQLSNVVIKSALEEIRKRVIEAVTFTIHLLAKSINFAENPSLAQVPGTDYYTTYNVDEQKKRFEVVIREFYSVEQALQHINIGIATSAANETFELVATSLDEIAAFNEHSH